MTYVPENATLCGCWAHASDEERERQREYERNNRLRPRALRSCPDCRGLGWYVGKPSGAAAMLKASEIVYADSIEGLRRQLLFEAEYSDLLEDYLREFVSLANRMRGLTRLRDDEQGDDG